MGNTDAAGRDPRGNAGGTGVAWGRPGAATSPGSSGDSALERTFGMVKEKLARHPDVSWWSATITTTQNHQLYLIRDQVESERRGLGHSVDVAFHTRNGTEIGQGSFALGSGEDAKLDELLDRAVRVAKQAGVPGYPSPAPAALPAVETVDREIAERPQQALELLRSQLSDALARERSARVASAEFFVFHDVSRMENSQGLVADLSGTRSTAEVVLLGRGANGREAEVQDLRYRRSVADLDLGRWVAGLAEQASDAPAAEIMATWRGPVVLRADVLDAYFGPLIQRLSGDSVYKKTSPYEVGTPVSTTELRGDRLTMSTDGTLPLGLATAPCDEEGVPGARTIVVENGRVRRFWANARFAHYLGIEPTGDWSNLVIEPGSRSAAELLGDGEVLEVVRFSWFNPSRGTGDFATEMRFGYLHRDGRRVPVKGGAVTGNAFGALGDAYFSRETEFVGRGRVPRYLRLEGLDVAGA